MVAPSDLLRLPFTRDLTEGGVAYAVRSLTRGMAARPADPGKIRHLVGSAAAELAFRRSLGGNDIPFTVARTLPFTQPDRYDVMVGGHRCEIRTQLITDRRQIAALQRDPSGLLRGSCSVSRSDLFQSDAAHRDLYVFAFVLALAAASARDLGRALANGQPCYLLHRMPASWRSPAVWRPLGPLSLESDTTSPMNVELAGCDADRNSVSRTVKVQGGSSAQSGSGLFSVAALGVRAPLQRNLQIGAAGPHLRHVVQPQDWSNIWIYGIEIILAGYLSREEFRRRLSSTKTNTPRTHSGAVCRLPVAALRPLPELLSSVKDWQVRPR